MASEKLYLNLDSILEKKKCFICCPKSRDDMQEYLKFTSVMNYCLNALRTDYREIMIESYINPVYRFWWVDKYCKSSFYRRRTKAITSFVNLYNLIYENYPSFSNNIRDAI